MIYADHGGGSDRDSRRCGKAGVHVKEEIRIRFGWDDLDIGFKGVDNPIKMEAVAARVWNNGLRSSRIECSGEEMDTIGGLVYLPDLC